MKRFRSIWFWILAFASFALIFGILVTGVRAAEGRRRVDDRMEQKRANLDAMPGRH